MMKGNLFLVLVSLITLSWREKVETRHIYSLAPILVIGHNASRRQLIHSLTNVTPHPPQHLDREWSFSTFVLGYSLEISLKFPSALAHTVDFQQRSSTSAPPSMFAQLWNHQSRLRLDDLVMTMPVPDLHLRVHCYHPRWTSARPSVGWKSLKLLLLW